MIVAACRESRELVDEALDLRHVAAVDALGQQRPVRVDDLDELYRQIKESGVVEKTVGLPRLHPVELQTWGQRAGFLVDPDGTQLNLIENLAEPGSASTSI